MGEYVARLRKKMLKIHEVARTHLGKEAVCSKEVYDRKLFHTSYKVGELVWCLHETRQLGVNPKLQKSFDGPYVVLEKWSDINIVVQTDKRGASAFAPITGP